MTHCSAPAPIERTPVGAPAAHPQRAAVPVDPAAVSGMTFRTPVQMRADFAALGYTIGRHHCDCTARIVIGVHAGLRYPIRTLSVHETDTGRHAFNVAARRDERFTAMQRLRGEVYSLAGSRIVVV